MNKTFSHGHLLVQGLVSIFGSVLAFYYLLPHVLHFSLFLSAFCFSVIILLSVTGTVKILRFEFLLVSLLFLQVRTSMKFELATGLRADSGPRYSKRPLRFAID